MTPRGTDWTLALLVGLLVASGVASWFVGSSGWAVAVHDVAGLALVGVLVFKGRRVFARPPRLKRGTGVVAGGLVVAALLSGMLWSGGANLRVAGYSGLAWHIALGAVLGVAVLVHAVARAKRPRRRDLSRRQFLTSAAVGAGAIAAWSLQRPFERVTGLRGARRRFTGSYEAAGPDFPVTSWVADDPRPLHRTTVLVTGHVARPYEAELRAEAELVATLDCTGGFYTTRRWGGVRLADLLATAQPRPGATHVRVVSHTGYRWSFGLDEARGMLLATHVDGEALSHGHGAPARLVAPGHRGFQWVKWVTRIELHDGPDPGALGSTVWSSFTPRGRGAA